MPLQTFKQFVRETIEMPPEPQDNAPRTVLITVDEVIEGLELLEGDRKVEVWMDYQSYGSISVNFFPEEIEQ